VSGALLKLDFESPRELPASAPQISRNGDISNVVTSTVSPKKENWLNRVYCGDARNVMESLPENSIDLSFWSPPYFVGKNYETHMDFAGWLALLKGAIAAHFRILKEGSFMVININDILCFVDPDMPRFMANNVSNKKVNITREEILKVKENHPTARRQELAALMGCSEQTIQRRLEHNNVRGGKHEAGTKVLTVGGFLQDWAEASGLYLYDRRIWHKDPCWANSRWHSNSYRAVDEFEYLYIFWKPGIVKVDRERLMPNEWAEWGSRAVWNIRSVSRNARHEAEFPATLAERVIRLLTDEGDVVLDPFVGSGTTTSVANKLRRKYVGVERLEKYADIARARTDEV
jgi:DNA modification methylase